MRVYKGYQVLTDHVTLVWPDHPKGHTVWLFGRPARANLFKEYRRR